MAPNSVAGHQSQERSRVRAEALVLAREIAESLFEGDAKGAEASLSALRLLLKNSPLKNDPKFSSELNLAASPLSHLLDNSKKLQQWAEHDLTQGDLLNARENYRKLDELLKKAAPLLNDQPKLKQFLDQSLQHLKELNLLVQRGEELGIALARGGNPPSPDQFFRSHPHLCTEQFTKLFEFAKNIGSRRWNEAFQTSTQLNSALTLLSPQPQTIYALLSQQSGERWDQWQSRLELLKESYLSLFKRSLEGDLRYSLTGAAEERATALLAADRIGSRVAQLIEARGLFRDDTESIKSAFQGLSESEKKLLLSTINKRWTEQHGTAYLHDNGYFEELKKLPENRSRGVIAAQKGDSISQSYYELREALFDGASLPSTRAVRVNELLERARQNGFLQRLTEHYNSKQSLDHDLQQRLPEGERREQARANAAGRFLDGDVYQLLAALKEEGFDAAAPLLSGKTKEYRDKLLSTAQALSRNLQNEIGALKDPVEREILLGLLSSEGTSKISRVDLFRHAVSAHRLQVLLNPVEKNTATKLLNAVEGMTKDEATRFIVEYKNKTGRDPHHDAARLLTGAQKKRVLRALGGAPESAEERKQLGEEVAAEARSGVYKFIAPLLNKDTDSLLNTSLNRLRFSGDSSSLFQLQRSAEAYEGAKMNSSEQISFFVSLAAGFRGGGRAPQATPSQTPAPSPAIRFSNFAKEALFTVLRIEAAKVGTNLALQGESYNSEALIADTKSSLANTFPVVLGNRVSTAFLKHLSLPKAPSSTIPGVIDGAVGGAAGSGISALLSLDWKGDPEGALRSALSSTIWGALSGVVGALGGEAAARRLAERIQKHTEQTIKETLKKAGNLTQEKAAELIQRTAEQLTKSFHNELKLALTAGAIGGATSGAVIAAPEIIDAPDLKQALIRIFSATLSGTAAGALGASAPIIGKGVNRIQKTSSPQKVISGSVQQKQGTTIQLVNQNDIRNLELFRASVEIRRPLNEELTLIVKNSEGKIVGTGFLRLSKDFQTSENFDFDGNLRRALSRDIASEDLAEFGGIFVDPIYRGQGLQKRMIDESIRIAKQNNVKVLVAFIEDSNNISRKNFEQGGFVKYATWDKPDGSGTYNFFFKELR